jgi:hypothetical protein
MQIKQRVFSRNNFKTTVVFTDFDKEEFHQGEMVNSGVGGMCFVTDRPLKSGTNIFIRMEGLAPDPYWPESAEAYLGEVRWCQEKQGTDGILYYIGVRFIVGRCKRCNAQIPPKKMNGVDLCPDCYGDLCGVSDGKLKDCLTNYWLGNIL